MASGALATPRRSRIPKAPAASSNAFVAPGDTAKCAPRYHYWRLLHPIMTFCSRNECDLEKGHVCIIAKFAIEKVRAVSIDVLSQSSGNLLQHTLSFPAQVERNTLEFAIALSTQRVWQASPAKSPGPADVWSPAATALMESRRPVRLTVRPASALRVSCGSLEPLRSSTGDAYLFTNGHLLLLNGWKAVSPGTVCRT